MDSDDYLTAFMSGFEFVLLAFEGRLREAGLDEASEARVEAFLRDYQVVLDQYRTRALRDARGLATPAPAPAAPPLAPVPTHVLAAVLSARHN